MSQERRSTAERDFLDLDSGLEALRSSPEFRGPVESLDGRDANEHIALIYESRAEQIDATVPFVRDGLERGEQCLYIYDENSRETVLAALRDAGVDADGALESGALTFKSVQETYLRNGTFDADEMVAFYAEALAEATAEFEALRVTAEMSWFLSENADFEEFVAYESRVNDLFRGEDSIALCQYDRESFSASVLDDVIETHPHLIYDNTVCHNFYYTPPEEFLGPDRPEREVERRMNTLLERAEAKTELQDHQRHLHKQNEITADPNRSFEEKLQAMFELGCERFNLELGAMAYVDVDDDWFEVEHVSDDHEHFEPGIELPLSETYCTAATEIKAAGSVSDPCEQGYDDIVVYREFGIRAYLGTYIGVDGGTDRTFFFVTSEPRERGFTEEERTFLRLMGQWVKYELERAQREDALMESEQRYRTLVENFPNGGVALYDDELRYTAAGGAFFDEIGITPDAETGTSVLDDFSDDFAAVAKPYLRASLVGEANSFERECNGAHLLAHAHPIRNVDDEVFAGMLVVQDISERKEREKRLEQFASVVSHGLRNPLEIAQIYLRMAREDGDPANFEEADQALDRMETLIQNLLTTALRGSGSAEVDRVSLPEVAESAWRNVETDGATVRVDAVDPILADETKLQSALENLFRNSVEHGSTSSRSQTDDSVEHRSTSGRAETDDRAERGSHGRSDDPLEIRVGPLEDGFYVEDTGPGIPAEDRSAVFEYGYSSRSGTGIGLAVVRDIVTAHGWDISVGSGAEGGARFEISDVTDPSGDR